jgi:WD40 repeat protein
MFDKSTQISLLNFLELRKYGNVNYLNNPLMTQTYNSNTQNNQINTTINLREDSEIQFNNKKKKYLSVVNDNKLNSLSISSGLNSNDYILKTNSITIDSNLINGYNLNNNYNTSGYERFNSINCVKFDSIDKKLVFATSTGALSTYYPKNHSITRVGSHSSAVKALAFSVLNIVNSVENTSNSSRTNVILTGDNNGTVRVWNNNFHEINLKSSHVLHNQGITDISFSINSNIYATSSEDKCVKIHDLEKNVEIISYCEHNSDVKSCDWAKPRSLLVSSSKDKKIRFYDPREKQSIGVMSNVHFDIINKVRFNSNSNWFLTASKEHNLKLIDFRMMKVLQKFDCHSLGVNSLAWHPFSNEAFCSVGEDKKLIFWRVGSDVPCSIENAHDKEIFDVCYNNIGTIVASGSKDSCIKFWN